MNRKANSLRDLMAGDSDSESDEGGILANMMSLPNLYNGSLSSDNDESKTPPRSPVRRTAVSPVRTPNRTPMKSPNRTPMKSPNDKRSLRKAMGDSMSPKVIGANLKRTLKKTGSSARNLLTPKKEPKTWQDDLHLPKNVTKEQAMAILLAKELADIDI